MRRTALIPLIALIAGVVFAGPVAAGDKTLQTDAQLAVAGCVKFEAGETGTKSESNLEVTVSDWVREGDEFSSLEYEDLGVGLIWVKAGQDFSLLGSQTKSISHVVFCSGEAPAE